jgi:hypothetical protein
LDATIIFLEQCGDHISLLFWFTKHRQLARQVGDSRALLIVEQEVMAPPTTRGLAGGMAHGDHICRENYEFTGIGRLALASAFSCIPDLCSRDLDLVVYDGRTLETTLSGSIPEYTYIGARTLTHHQPWLGLLSKKSEDHGS